MPANGSSAKNTTHCKMPTKSDGTKDKRYTTPQFTKSDGSVTYVIAQVIKK